MVRKPSQNQNSDDQQPIHLQGLKYFAKLRPLLAQLHDDATARDTAGNRTLHFDQYCMLVLLYVLNPGISSLRALSQASELTKVQAKLGNAKASLGSLSESARLFDPERLKAIIGQLAEQVQAGKLDSKTAKFAQGLIAVDGSVVNALPSIMAASLLKQTTGSAVVHWRLHTHFEVASFTPQAITVTPDGGGENDERAVLARSLDADKIYAMDRGYAKFKLLNAIDQRGSSYLCRLRDNAAYDVLEDRPLTDGDRAAGVLSDQTVLLGKTSKLEDRPDHLVRLVCVKCTPHKNRTGGKVKGSKAPSSDGVLRIATNMPFAPAEIIAILYSYRWTVEIFFRFYKQLMGGAHLLSRSKNGIELQVYCAMIACLLMSLWVGGKPSKRTFEMIGYYFTGLANEEELLAHLAKIRQQAAASAEEKS
ncbi:IS4 family transposase [Blastopirellula sp. J2-11]|nr:IS4 family transposase [Blastopirellula sp. J2-11]UUO09261.1 IS4 family transposase [Blastopirellula sp. J2-11]